MRNLLGRLARSAHYARARYTPVLRKIDLKFFGAASALALFVLLS